MTWTRGFKHILLTVALILFFNLIYFVWPASRPYLTGNFQGLPKGVPTQTDAATLVKRVVDGDTFELADGRKVRLIGVDTSESVKPNTPVQCFSKEASRYLKDLIEGKEVRLEKDVSETDQYGRLLRYVYLGNDFVNEKLAREGYAYAATFPPDVTHANLFRDAQTDARANERGLWSPQTCNGKR